MGIYSSVDQLIGGTPLLELCRLERQLDLGARVLVKLESFNPGGSVKDRVARAMLDDAEASGRLAPGGTIVEPTSGNTGIGLASVAGARGDRVGIGVAGKRGRGRPRRGRPDPADTEHGDGRAAQFFEVFFPDKGKFARIL